jgi:hypothetical protein
VAGTTPINTARAAIQSLLAPLGALTTCAIIGYSISYHTHISDERGDPGAAVWSRGIFIWRTATPSELAITYIPGIKESLVDPTTMEIAADSVAGLLSELTSGIWVTPFGYTLSELGAAFVQIEP